jgi:hypothetical protein
MEDLVGTLVMLLGMGSSRMANDPLLKAALNADSASSEGAMEEDDDRNGDRGDNGDGDDCTCSWSRPIRDFCCKNVRGRSALCTGVFSVLEIVTVGKVGGFVVSSALVAIAVLVSSALVALVLLSVVVRVVVALVLLSVVVRVVVVVVVVVVMVVVVVVIVVVVSLSPGAAVLKVAVELRAAVVLIVLISYDSTEAVWL